jgi:hypothetical protein
MSFRLWRGYVAVVAIGHPKWVRTIPRGVTLSPGLHYSVDVVVSFVLAAACCRTCTASSAATARKYFRIIGLLPGPRWADKVRIPGYESVPLTLALTKRTSNTTTDQNRTKYQSDIFQVYSPQMFLLSTKALSTNFGYNSHRSPLRLPYCPPR